MAAAWEKVQVLSAFPVRILGPAQPQVLQEAEILICVAIIAHLLNTFTAIYGIWLFIVLIETA
jgi:O-antigen ligase